MAIKTVSKNRKVDEPYLLNAISSLRKNMTDYEVERNAERKAEWESFRNKYNDGLDKTEESLKKLTAPYRA
jgi:hypothetical protein